MRRTASRTRHPSYRAASAPFSTAAITILLAACAVPAGAPTGDEAAVTYAALMSVDRAFASAALDDERDLAPSASGGALVVAATAVEAADGEPRIVLRRVGMQRYRELEAVRVDRSSDPPTAVVDLTVGIRGEAQLWQVWSDPALRRELAGSKRIDVHGPLRLQLERRDRGWLLVGVRRGALTQGPRAAEVDAWAMAPEPLLAGEPGRLTVSLIAPVADDVFAVGARGHVFSTFGPLAPLGAGEYAGAGVVPEQAPVGRSLAFLTALNVTATFDLGTTDDGAFRSPYTETILPVVARVAAGE